MTAPASQESKVNLEQRLGRAQIGLRDDLETHRHLIHGKPVYVVRDPLTLQCFQFNLDEYQIFCHLTPNQTLADIFQTMVQSNLLAAEDKDQFYKFILNLHQLNFLHLPVSDDKALYKRYVQRKNARKKQRLFSLFFLQIPLLNPDSFLERTVHLARFFFSRTFFIVYLFLLTAALGLVMHQFNEIRTFAGAMFSVGNMAILWLCLILLKAIHELGHGYACKIFGGQVTDMGVYLIMLTPCAYVDVTSSWGFSQKLKRIIVGLGGVYFESLIAIGALLVWSTAETYSTRMLAYNIFFLASVTTILMNINPLMRFDGYYILSDLTEMPNLRARARDQVSRVFKWLLLRIKPPKTNNSLLTSILLLVFGICSSIYKVSIVIALSYMIAKKAFLFGLTLAGLYIAMTLFSILVRLFHYLRKSPEAARYRFRTSLAVLTLVTMVPLAFIYVPVPIKTQIQARLERLQLDTLHNHQSGIVQALPAEIGCRLVSDTPIIQLANFYTTENLLTAQNQLTRAVQTLEAYQFDKTIDPTQIAHQQETIQHLKNQLSIRQQESNQLSVTAPTDGILVARLPRESIGRFIPRGEIVAQIASGKWICKGYIHQKDLVNLQLQLGHKAIFRSAINPMVSITGTLTYLSPTPIEKVDDLTLTTAGIGSLPIDPQNHRLLDAFYQFTVSLDSPPPYVIHYGSTGIVSFKGPPQSLGLILYRKIIRFVSDIQLENQL